MPIKILKASAGSGKTYNLAKEYIRLLLTSDKPDAYRHILAVLILSGSCHSLCQRDAFYLFPFPNCDQSFVGCEKKH